MHFYTKVVEGNVYVTFYHVLVRNQAYKWHSALIWPDKLNQAQYRHFEAPFGVSISDIRKVKDSFEHAVWIHGVAQFL